MKVCKDDISLIENYEKAKADNFKGWVCHHRMETHRRNGKLRKFPLPASLLIEYNVYYNRPASELIYLTKAEHRSLHNKHATEETHHKWSQAQQGRTCSEETRKKLSESSKKHPECWFKKGHPAYHYNHTDEARRRISEAKLGDKNPTKKSAAAYKEYKANGGTLSWNEFQKEFKNASTLL